MRTAVLVYIVDEELLLVGNDIDCWTSMIIKVDDELPSNLYHC